jgi:hypothetical protein
MMTLFVTAGIQQLYSLHRSALSSLVTAYRNTFYCAFSLLRLCFKVGQSRQACVAVETMIGVYGVRGLMAGLMK